MGMQYWKKSSQTGGGNMINGKNVVVTGGAGFLGSRVVRHIVEGFTPERLFIPRQSNYNLCFWKNCVAAVRDMDVVIHLAANVGGIGYNQKHPGRLFYDNAMMGIQMIEAARIEGVEKFVVIGTVCAYPKFTPSPFSEEDLWNGYPEETNAPYGLAKKMLLVQAQAYRQEYGMNVIYLLPVNLYGVGDNFKPEQSHVIPALIKKFVDAKRMNIPTVEVWGTGCATREFLYVDDAARAIILATERYNKPEPVNIGSGMEISIAELAKHISDAVGYEGKIMFDESKPDGQPARRLDVSRAKQEFGFEALIPFQEGLKKTVDWYTRVS
jgi:GDP-L-fucose synthase